MGCIWTLASRAPEPDAPEPDAPEPDAPELDAPDLTGHRRPPRCTPLAASARLREANEPEGRARAEALCRRVGPDGKAAYRHASALDLPFENATFDGAYMMHVVMNIEDKLKLC